MAKVLELANLGWNVCDVVEVEVKLVKELISKESHSDRSHTLATAVDSVPILSRIPRGIANPAPLLFPTFLAPLLRRLVTKRDSLILMCKETSVVMWGMSGTTLLRERQLLLPVLTELRRSPRCAALISILHVARCEVGGRVERAGGKGVLVADRSGSMTTIILRLVMVMMMTVRLMLLVHLLILIFVCEIHLHGIIPIGRSAIEHRMLSLLVALVVHTVQRVGWRLSARRSCWRGCVGYEADPPVIGRRAAP